MPAGSHSFQVGSIYCTALSDGYCSYPASWFFPNADPETLARAVEARRLLQGKVLSPYTCLLIETGRHAVLIDTGTGPSLTTGGAIQARLEMAGVRPRDIDTVVITHAHPDHIGGAVDARGRPAFPNACYVLAETEWEFWTASKADLGGMRVPDDVKDAMGTTARDCLRVLRHQVEPVCAEKEVIPGVRVVPAPGHTPGHLAVLVASAGQRLLHIGDAAVNPLHLECPQWENGFDLASAAAGHTRRELLDRAVSEGMAVMAGHFPFPSVGRVAAKANEGGWQWTPGW